jgi:EmrB/QacA subfamily drug resistance transporter
MLSACIDICQYTGTTLRIAAQTRRRRRKAPRNRGRQMRFLWSASRVVRSRERVKKTWVLVAAVVGSAMTFIDGTAVNVALPVVQRDLHASGSAMQWVVEGYALFLTALILLGGALGDRYGRRRLFVIGIALFTLGSVACGLAPAASVLIVARCVQGVGAALAMPESLALLNAAYEGDERGRAIGTWSGFASITAALGPLLGGWLAQHASWRYVFLINVPLAVAVVAIALARVPESRDDALPPGLDGAGALLATLGLGALTFGLIRAQDVAPGFSGTAAIAAGAALLAAFVAVEARVRTPMMPLDLFRSRAFAGANAYTFFLYAAIGGSLYFLPFQLVDVARYTPTAAGAALLPFVLLQFALSRWSGGLIGRLGARAPLVVGAILAALAFALFAVASPNAPYWTSYFPAAVALGVGGAFFVTPLTTTVFDAVDVERSGVASGVNNAVSRGAGLVAVALFGFAYATIAPGGTAAASLAARLAAFRTVMELSVVLCAAAAATALALPARVRR